MKLADIPMLGIIAEFGVVFTCQGTREQGLQVGDRLSTRSGRVHKETLLLFIYISVVEYIFIFPFRKYVIHIPHIT